MALLHRYSKHLRQCNRANTARIYVHPLYYAMALFYIIIGKGAIFVAFFAVILIHEGAHAMVAARLGYVMRRVTLMPYGAIISRAESLPSRHSIKIALAGPSINMCMAIAIMGLWWIAPTTYMLTRHFCYANVSIMLINLLPCYPLDGARIVIGMVKNKLLAIKVTRIIGIIVGLIMLGLGIASIFYTFNPTIGVLGAYLAVSANMGSEMEMYEHITANLPWVKDYARGVQKREIYIEVSSPIRAFLHHIDRGHITEFYIMSNGMVVARYNECEVKYLLEEQKLSTKIEEVVHYS